MATITDVARLAKVSSAAVSLVLNDPQTTRVGDEKKKEILRAAKTLNYTPNRFARALSTRTAGILGLVVPMRDPIFFNYFISGALSGIQRCIIERGYHLMVYSHSASSGKITKSQILQSKYVDGLIFINTRLCTAANMSATIEELSSAGTPFVMLNAYYGHDRINYVGVDDVEIGYIGGIYLIKKGHSRIALLGGSRRCPMTQVLLRGFKRALEESNLRLDNSLVAHGEHEPATTKAAVRTWLNMKRRPTAIFSADDQMVPDIYEVVHDRGLRVPEDVAILGRGDFPFASLLSPKLTTLRIPTSELGYRAAELLIDSLSDPTTLPQRILLPTTLVERASV